MAISFEYDSVIRGYHIYKEIREASHGEMFDCVRETGNRFDPFAVAVISEDGKIIGHVPKLISAAASLFLYILSLGARRVEETIVSPRASR